MGNLPDAVYVCRPGENPELRISLRSLAANAAGIYRNVWIVGTVLPWLRNIAPLPLEPREDKFENQRQSLTAVVNHPDLSDEFVLLNDDHFIIQPIADWRTYHLGTAFGFLSQLFLGDMEGTNLNEWAHAVLNTALWTQATADIAEPLCYEAHIPLLFDKAKVAAVLNEYPTEGYFAVGETYPITGAAGEGIVGQNTKVGDAGARGLLTVLGSGMPYVSTEDNVFEVGKVGDWLREMFPDPCIYEEAS
jgi:hypothetical protein